MDERAFVRPSDPSEPRASCSAVGKRWVHPVDRSSERRAARGGDPARERPSGSNADLLAEDRTHRQLEPVRGSGHPDAWRLTDGWTELGVVRKHGVDRGRIGVEVEQSPCRLRECRRFHRVIRDDPEHHLVTAGSWCDADHRGSSVRRADRSSERRPIERLDTGDRAIAQESHQRIYRERRPVPETALDRCDGHDVSRARRQIACARQRPSSPETEIGELEAGRHVGVRQHVLDRARGHEAPPAQEGGVRRRLRDLLHVVSDEHRRGRDIGRRRQSLEQQLSSGQIQARGGFVEQQQLRTSEQRSGEQHPLALTLAARCQQPGRETVASHELEQLVGEPAIVGVERLHPGNQGGAFPGEHHVSHREVVGDGLRHMVSQEADPLPDTADVCRSQAGAEDLDGSGRRMPDPTGQVQHGGLARAVRTQDRPRLALADGERHRSQDLVRRDRDRRVLDADDLAGTIRLHGFPSMPTRAAVGPTLLRNHRVPRPRTFS